MQLDQTISPIKLKAVPPTLVDSAGRWLILSCILLAYIYNVERWQPTVFFGRPQDDGIYFSTAKSLAQGNGYRLISFPGTPLQTKYPILYPYLLFGVWKLAPNFPGNLKPAIRLTEFFGCWSLIVTFLLLRKYGISERAALFLTAVCAFQPFFLSLSGMVMSDVPFMALLLNVLLLADGATSSGATALLALATGTLAGLSVGFRTVGAAVVAGIFLLALRKRAFREAFLFAVAAGAAIAIESWPTLLNRTGVAPGILNAAEPGWNQVLAYYTDYVGFVWRMGIPSIWALVRLVETNVASLASSPGSILMGRAGGPLGTTALLSVLVWVGVLRQWRRPEWQATGYVLISYSCVLLFWLPLPERLLLPFLPVLLAGLWLEMPRLGAMCKASLRGAASLSQRVLAVALACLLILPLAFAAWNYLVRDPRQLRVDAGAQAHALEERMQAYQWIRANTNPNDRIAAWQDGTMYFYTSRQGLRPVEFLPQDFYMDDRESLQRDLAHICDAPRHVGVRYWLTADDDFLAESGIDRISARMKEIAAVLPVVFRSSGNYAQIHDASCLTDLDRADCRPIAAILFPDSLPK